MLNVQRDNARNARLAFILDSALLSVSLPPPPLTTRLSLCFICLQLLPNSARLRLSVEDNISQCPGYDHI